MTSIINTVGKQTSRFANIGASIGLLFILCRNSIDFLFSEEIQDLSNIQKQFVYGFTTGFMFKFWTKGLKSGLLVGTIGAVLAATSSVIYSSIIFPPKQLTNNNFRSDLASPGINYHSNIKMH